MAITSLDELSAVVAERCHRLDTATLQPQTDFRLRPRPVQPGSSPRDGIIPPDADLLPSSWRSGRCSAG